MSSNNDNQVNFTPPGGKSKYYRGVVNESTIEGDDTSPSDVRPPKKSHGIPLTPAAAGATLINLVLASGPFSYPYAFVQTSPLMGIILMGIISVLSYMTASFMVESLSIS